MRVNFGHCLIYCSLILRRILHTFLSAYRWKAQVPFSSDLSSDWWRICIPSCVARTQPSPCPVGQTPFAPAKLTNPSSAFYQLLREGRSAAFVLLGNLILPLIKILAVLSRSPLSTTKQTILGIAASCLQICLLGFRRWSVGSPGSRNCIRAEGNGTTI